VSLSAGQEGLDLVRRIVAGVVVGPHDRLDHLGLVRHLGHDPRLHGLDPTGLHGGQYFGLLPLRYAAESHSCNNKGKKSNFRLSRIQCIE
jgi:hypothetical protein